MKITFPLLILLAFLISACEPCPHYTRTKVVGLTGPGKIPKEARRPYGSVKLFETKEAVATPYTVIALMSVEGGAGDEAAFIKAFLYRAADLGADGVILYRGNAISATQGGFNAYGGGWNTGQDVSYRGEAIRFK